jgi:MoxR-like ATPase
MSLPDSITREDLIHATDEIAPLDSSGNQEPASSIILLNGHRYDPEVVLTRALKNTTGIEGSETGIPKDDDSLATFYAERNIPCLPSTNLDSAVQSLKSLKVNPRIQQDLSEEIANKERVLNRFQSLFSPEKVAGISEEDVIDFLHREHNGHWKGLHGYKEEIRKKFDLFRSALAILVDDNDPVDRRLDTIRPKNGQNLAPGAKEGILTAVLLVEYPEKYGVWNDLSADALKSLEIWPAFKRGATFGERYLTINEVLRTLSQETGVDLWTLDSLIRLTKETGKSPIVSILTRRAVEDTIAIASKIIDTAGITGEQTPKFGRTKLTTEEYQGVIKPMLDAFVKAHGKTPNLLLGDILNEVLVNDPRLAGFEKRTFPFHGQTVKPYTWATITQIDPSIKNFKISYYPQLYISINREEVKYGFSYGDKVKSENRSVQKFREEAGIRSLTRDLLSQVPTLRIQIDKEPEDPEYLSSMRTDITAEILNGSFDRWDSSVTFTERWEKSEIPDDIGSRIHTTLSDLVPLFLAASDPGNIIRDESPTPPVTPTPEIPTWSTIAPSLACSFTCDQIPFAGLHFPEEEKQRLSTEILGALSSGKHIILTGPPGTGKSKIARAVCEAIAGPDNYKMCTASNDWSVYETIGGYRPRPDGTLRFYPGAFLRSFRNGDEPANRWLIIDEINRADIDKAFGSLFSALAGDRVDLPFEIDDEPVCLVGRPKEETPLNPCTFIIHPDWRIIATMNTFDKSSLYEMSYAFMRRFAFIMVDSPKTVDAGLVGEYARAWELEPDEERCRQIADLWNLVNRHRQIGPALFRDIYQYLDAAPGAAMESAVSMYLFPQLEGLLEETQKAFIAELLTLESIVDKDRLKQNAAMFFHITLKGSP